MVGKHMETGELSFCTLSEIYLMKHLCRYKKAVREEVQGINKLVI